MYKLLGLLLAVLLPLAELHAVEHIKRYTTHTGKHVASHYRSSPDHSQLNNWSMKGNINPHTGKAGTHQVKPYASKNIKN